MRSDYQARGPVQVRQRRKLVNNHILRGIQDYHMSVQNVDLYTRDEQDAPVSGERKKFPVKGPDLMIGNSQDFKTLISSL